MDQRLEVVDRKIEALKSEMNQRFNDVDRRFVDLKSDMDRRFNLLQWVVILNTSLLIAAFALFVSFAFLPSALLAQDLQIAGKIALALYATLR